MNAQHLWNCGVLRGKVELFAAIFAANLLLALLLGDSRAAA
jgi:hypothetical protein